MGTTTYTYDYTGFNNTGAGAGDGTLSLTLTVSTPATNSTGLGLGYAVTAISGEVGGTAITGEVGTGGMVAMDIKTYDNTVFPSDSSGFQGSSYGIDGHGVDFTVGTTHYDVAYLNNGLQWTLVNGNGSMIGGSHLTLVDSSAPCYCPGTLIRTDRGEVAIEDLRAGDALITLDGSAKPVRWIGRRSYHGRFVAERRDILPVTIRAGALGDGLPRRDLAVSPLHAMFLDGLLIPAGLLVNGASITQAEQVEAVHYIHLELDQHAVIWAEGAASESFVDDNSRGMFHNAHEHAALLPDHKPVPTVYCFPRIVDGEVLEAVKRAIDLRAGLPVPSLGEPLRGHVDGWEGNILRGWAQNLAKPEVPVCIEVLVDGEVAARTLANLFRGDLRVAGLGSGCHGFQVEVPASPMGRTVEVRRVVDGKLLGTMAPERFPQTRPERQAA